MRFSCAWGMADHRRLLGPLTRISHGDSLLFILTSAQVRFYLVDSVPSILVIMCVARNTYAE